MNVFCPLPASSPSPRVLMTILRVRLVGTRRRPEGGARGTRGGTLGSPCSFSRCTPEAGTCQTSVLCRSAGSQTTPSCKCLSSQGTENHSPCLVTPPPPLSLSSPPPPLPFPPFIPHPTVPEFPALHGLTVLWGAVRPGAAWTLCRGFVHSPRPPPPSSSIKMCSAADCKS